MPVRLLLSVLVGVFFCNFPLHAAESLLRQERKLPYTRAIEGDPLREETVNSLQVARGLGLGRYFANYRDPHYGYTIRIENGFAAAPGNEIRITPREGGQELRARIDDVTSYHKFSVLTFRLNNDTFSVNLAPDGTLIFEHFRGLGWSILYWLDSQGYEAEYEHPENPLLDVTVLKSDKEDVQVFLEGENQFAKGGRAAVGK